MSDFQDFLKHSYAHVAIGEFKPGRFEEAAELYQQAIATFTTGLKGAYLLREPGTDRGISVIFLEHEDDMEANDNGTQQAILKKMAPLFNHAPKTGVYEVVSDLHAPTPEPAEAS